MKPKILLVNPYIEDFAAYDHYSKPMGLVTLAGRLKDRFDLHFVNALNRLHPANRKARVKPDGTGNFTQEEIPKPAALKDIPRKFKRYGIPEAAFVAELKAVPFAPDYVFVTSGMTYWYTGLAHTVRLLRDAFPGAPVVLGGIYASLLPEHARSVVAPDFLVSGQEPEAVLKAVGRITGVESAGNPAAPPDYGILGEYYYAPVLTSLGCVFRCDYCASFRLTKYRRSPPSISLT